MLFVIQTIIILIGKECDTHVSCKMSSQVLKELHIHMNQWALAIFDIFRCLLDTKFCFGDSVEDEFNIRTQGECRPP